MLTRDLTVINSADLYIQFPATLLSLQTRELLLINLNSRHLSVLRMNQTEECAMKRVFGVIIWYNDVVVNLQFLFKPNLIFRQSEIIARP